MKNNQKIVNRSYIPYILLVLSCFILKCHALYSQEVNEANPKIEPDLYLDYYKSADQSRILEISLSITENGQIKYLSGELVNIYLNELSEEGLIGIVITDVNGKGELHSREEKFNSAISNHTNLQFYASLNDKDTYTQEAMELTIYDANLEMQCFEEDSVKYVKAVFSLIDSTGKLVPQEDIEIHFYVQRMLGLLPIGGDYTYTDQDGTISIEFPDDLPGDSDGNIEIFVQVEDEEYFGNVKNQTSMLWGVPLESKHKFEKGSLFGNRNNAPSFLIFVSNLIIIGVWIIILYLVFQIYRIRKLGSRK